MVSYLSSRFPKWAAVDAALSNEGWKLITLLRLSPVIPWNVLNYALSVTGAVTFLAFYPVRRAELDNFVELPFCPWCLKIHS